MPRMSASQGVVATIIVLLAGAAAYEFLADAESGRLENVEKGESSPLESPFSESELRDILGARGGSLGEDTAVKRKAKLQIIREGKAVIPQLIDALSLEERRLRRRAWGMLWTLSGHRFPRTSDENITLSKNPSLWSTVVIDAYEAWWEEHKDMRRIDWILTQLRSKDEAVRLRAAAHLANLVDAFELDQVKRDLPEALWHTSDVRPSGPMRLVEDAEEMEALIETVRSHREALDL